MSRIDDIRERNRKRNMDGGPGSGNHGHAGIPGVKGGSSPSGASAPPEGINNDSASKAISSCTSAKEGMALVKAAGKIATRSTQVREAAEAKYLKQLDQWAKKDTKNMSFSQYNHFLLERNVPLGNPFAEKDALRAFAKENHPEQSKLMENEIQQLKNIEQRNSDWEKALASAVWDRFISKYRNS